MRVISRTPAAIAAVEQYVMLFVAKIAHDLEAWAKAHAPVDTGFLKGSIEAVRSGVAEWIVQVGAEYAAYVELGTSRMAAQPYLTPAIETVRANAGVGSEEIHIMGPAGA